MQNTKVLNKKVNKKDEILFLSGKQCIRASGLFTLKGPQALGPLPSQTYPCGCRHSRAAAPQEDSVSYLKGFLFCNS